jgi:hypothetical protein
MQQRQIKNPPLTLTLTEYARAMVEEYDNMAEDEAMMIVTDIVSLVTIYLNDENRKGLAKELP